MDPNREPAPMTHSTKAERDSEINRNSRGTPKQAGQGDGNDKLFTHTQSSWPSVNTQRQGDPYLQFVAPGTSSETRPDSHRSSISSQSSSNAKVNSNDASNDSATPSSSKSSLHTSNTANGLDLGSSGSYKGPLEVAGILNGPSTSGTNQAGDANMVKENRKRPSSLRLNRPNLDDDSSSDTGNDDYSLGSEDGCIYTYRGGEHLADLPSSFFSLDMGLPLDRHLPQRNYPVAQGAGNAREGSRASSPDMDFLEMDFDPGPSNEVDSGDESTPDADLDISLNMPEESEPVREPSPEVDNSSKPIPAVPLEHNYSSSNMPSTSRGTSQVEKPETVPSIVYGPYITHVNPKGEKILVRRTMLHWVAPAHIHHFSGELVHVVPGMRNDTEEQQDAVMQLVNRTQINHNCQEVPKDTQHPDYYLPPILYHKIKGNILLANKQKAESEGQQTIESSSEPRPCTSTATASCVEPPRSMIWTEEAACERQVTQIGTSACGATAIINVFNALGVPVDIERINIAVGTRLRAETAEVPRYLFSRAVAGCTAADLVNGMQVASGGLVTARFFPTYPERAMSLSHWLADWISLGAVPILTLNLQNANSDGEMADAWHHQMVFGVSPSGVYLSNPLECLRETALWPRLVSPSVLLVKSSDVISRFTEDTDLAPLCYVPDERFHTLNVYGQVANLIREARILGTRVPSRRIRIPAAYQPGITVAVLTGSEAHRRLKVATELPLLSQHEGNDPA